MTENINNTTSTNLIFTYCKLFIHSDGKEYF